ncbi:MAG: RNA-binding protein [Candidatus Hydrogenedentes bacterium]|nr:RNA-binding protein [Candidatus Hydrogenedentota bacterium]
MKIYVGNLSYRTTDSDLADAFGQYGEVDSARVVMDRDTNRSRGFGFVEMPDEAGKSAIAGLDGKDLQGRTLKVNEARPMNDSRGGDRRPRTGGGYRRYE